LSLGVPCLVCIRRGVRAIHVSRILRAILLRGEVGHGVLDLDRQRRGAVLRSESAVQVTRETRGGGDSGDRIVDPALNRRRTSTGSEESGGGARASRRGVELLSIISGRSGWFLLTQEGRGGLGRSECERASPSLQIEDDRR